LKTGSTYNYAIITDKRFPKPKWGYKASRKYMTSTDNVRHRCLTNIHYGELNRKYI